MEVQVTKNSEAESRVSASPDRLAPKKNNPVRRIVAGIGERPQRKNTLQIVQQASAPTKRDEEFGLRWVGFGFGSGFGLGLGHQSVMGVVRTTQNTVT